MPFDTSALSSSNALPVSFDGAVDEDVALPKPVAFLMALSNVHSAIRDNEATYNNPASTDRQLRAIERTVKANFIEAFDAHLDLFREDMKDYAAAAKKCHALYEAMHDNKAKRMEMLAKAMNITMADMTSNGHQIRYDVIPMRLQVQFWILAIIFIVGSELALFHPLALMPSWPLVLAVVAIMTLPEKLHEILSTRLCFYWYSIYSVSALAGLFLEPAMHVLATEACTGR